MPRAESLKYPVCDSILYDRRRMKNDEIFRDLLGRDGYLVVGKSVVRTDALDKCLDRTRLTADYISSRVLTDYVCAVGSTEDSLTSGLYELTVSTKHYYGVHSARAVDEQRVRVYHMHIPCPLPLQRGGAVSYSYASAVRGYLSKIF